MITKLESSLSPIVVTLEMEPREMARMAVDLMHMYRCVGSQVGNGEMPEIDRLVQLLMPGRIRRETSP